MHTPENTPLTRINLKTQQMNECAKILIVDDNPHNLQVLISILERLSYEIRPALSGEIALAAMDTFTPDLILLDINMTGIDGYETCRRLKANERTQDIPVIFISAKDGTDDKLKAFQAGGVDYVTKPFQIDEVLARVNTHIELNLTKRNLKNLLDERTNQLTQNEVRHINLLNMLEIGIVQNSADGTIVFANPSALRLLGLSESSIYGKTNTDAMWEVIYEDGSPFPVDSFPVSIAFATGQAVRDVVMGVYRPLTKDRVWLLVSATPELDETGGIQHIVCTFNDVTERTIFKVNLAESKQRLKMLVESAMDAIITLNESLCVVLYNSAAATLFGVSKDEAIGMSIECFMPQRFRDAHAGHVHAFGQAGVTSRAMGRLGQVMGLRANGEEFAIEASISQFDVEGEKQYTIIMRDISERRRIESALQTSLAEKTGLLNEVHHRVKNNLQVITSLLRLEAGRSDHGDTKAVLTEMQARIRAMALLHESLYRKGIFASIDLGTYLNQVVTQAFRAQLSRAGVVRLQLDLASVQVSLDQAMPCGLLVNELISNCFKHAFPDEHGGELKVALRQVEGTNQVHLMVSDNGLGLPADFAEKIENSLGLQLVSDLARQLGGKLEVGENVMKENPESPSLEAAHKTQFGVTFAIDVIKSSALSVD
jgi:PAS domain S-box-containing protein